MTTPILGAANGGNQRLLNYIAAGKVRHAVVPVLEWSVLLDVADGILTESDGSQELDLNTLFPRNTFPTNVMRMECYARLIQVFAGGAISAGTVTIGVTGTADGFLTSTNIFTGATLGMKETVAASLRAPRFEAALAPVAVITSTTANVTAYTTGKLLIGIRYSPMTAEFVL